MDGTVGGDVGGVEGDEGIGPAWVGNFQRVFGGTGGRDVSWVEEDVGEVVV